MMAAALATPRSQRRVIVIPGHHRGHRLDRALTALMPEQSRAALQRLMVDGRVRIDGASSNRG